jgi:hypothetical protein
VGPVEPSYPPGDGCKPRDACGAAKPAHGGVAGRVGPVEPSQGSFYTARRPEGSPRVTLTPRGSFFTAGRPERSLQANMTLQKLLEANVGLLETTLTQRGVEGSMM